MWKTHRVSTVCLRLTLKIFFLLFLNINIFRHKKAILLNNPKLNTTLLIKEEEYNDNIYEKLSKIKKLSIKFVKFFIKL